MPSEVEVKLKIDNFHVIAKYLEEKGFQKIDECIETDQYFNHPCRDMALTDEALRLRSRKCSTETHGVLTYKGPRAPGLDYFKVREEIEIQINPIEIEKIEKLLERLGFRLVLAFTKTRILYSSKTGIKASLDNLHGVGWFLELELIDESAKNIVVEVVRDLIEKYECKPVEKTYLEICIETKMCNTH